MTRVDKLIDFLNVAGIPAALVMTVGMVVFPWFAGGFSWAYVHAVWMDWQTLNVGVLAFAASLIAFNISRYHDNQQRHREFIAARSFLPEALSELISYFKASAKLLTDALEYVSRDQNISAPQPSFELPAPPEGYREIFSRCISLAEHDVAEHLSRILMRMQIHNARITSLVDELRPESRTVVLKQNIITYLYRLGELQALTGQVFNYARGLEPFKRESLTWEDFTNAYNNLDIWVEEIEDLEGFTRRAIKRAESEERNVSGQV